MPSGAHLSPWEPLDISFLGEAIRPGMVPWAAEPPKSPAYSVHLSASPSPTRQLLQGSKGEGL